MHAIVAFSSRLRLFLVAILVISSSSISAQWLPGQPAVGTGIEYLTAVGPSTYYGTANLSFYKSTDAAATWSHETLNYPTYSIFFDYIFQIAPRGIKFTSASNGLIYGTNFYGYQIIHQTIDGGATWMPVHNRTGGDLLDLASANSMVLVACGTHGRIERSIDGGTTWNDVSSPTTNTLYSVSFSSAANGMAVGDNVILKTSDGGSTWTSTTTSAQLRSVSFVDANVAFAVGTQRQLMRTIDGGATWIVIDPGIPGFVQTFTKVVFVNATTGFLATSKGVYKTSDQGNFWSLQNSMPSENVTLLSFYDALNGFVTFTTDYPYQNLFYKTPNAGEPTPQNEAAVVVFEPHTGGECRGTYPVRVKISNFGAKTLTSATLQWSVEGMQQPDYSWTGDIATGDTSAYITVGSFNFNKTNVDLNVTVTSSQPNGQPDDFEGNDQIDFKFRFNKLTGAYTIGGTAPDFERIRDAVELLRSWKQCGDVVFNIRTGTYEDFINLENMSWLSATSTLTFQSESGKADDVVIHFSSTAVVNLESSPYTRIRNLTINGVGTTVILIRGESEGILIEGNSLNNPLLSPPFLSAIQLTDMTGNIVIRGNYFKESLVGIYFGFYSLQPFHASTTLIEDNTFDRQVSVAIDCERTVNPKLVILRNKFISPTSSASYWALNFSFFGNTAQIENNYFQLAVNSGAVLADGGKYSFNFNTIVRRGASSWPAVWFQNLSHSNFRNNNIASYENGGCIEMSLADEGDVVMDYNNIFTTGQLFGSYSSRNKEGVSDNLATWRGLSGFDLHSISVDPQVVPDSIHIQPNSSNYALQRAGIPIAGTTIDIDGDARNATAPTIGCDEFVSPSTDLGIALVSIPSIACGPVAISVKVTNYGTALVPNYSVEWGKTGSVTTTPVNTPIAAGTSTVIPLGNLSLPSTSLIQAKITALNDAISRNDTTSVSVKTGGLSGTYTIGASGNYTTFAAAFGALKASGICGPVMLNVQSGNYTEAITIPEIPGASATNTIILQSETNNSADVTLAVGNSLKIDGTDWLTLQYFTITNTTSETLVQLANYATHVVIQHNRFAVSFSIWYGISSTADAANEYLTIADNTFEAMSPDPSIQMISAIFLNTSLGALPANINDQNIITGNTFSVPCTGSTIAMISQYGFSITGNTISNASLGIEFTDVSGSYVVSNNRIASSGIGIFLRHSISQDAPTGLFANNVITTTNEPAFWPTNSDNFRFLHNTCITQNGEATLAIDRDAVNNPLSDNVTIENNIVIAGSKTNCLITNSVLKMTCDYNIYYSLAPSVFMYNNGPFLPTEDVTEFFPGLYQWQQRSGHDAHSSVHLPIFVSDGNYHIDNDMLVDGKGTPAGVVFDADGIARSSTAPDPGAYEFSAPHSANDAGIASITRPSQCGESFTIKATVHNYGTNTLSNATVNWKLNGSDKPSVAWTGSLAPNGESEIVLGDVILHPSDSNKIVAWTALPNGTGDSHLHNDTATVDNIYQKLSGNYSVGYGSEDFRTFAEASNYLTTVGVCGPTQLSILEGEYQQVLKLRLIPGLSPDAPLLVTKDPAGGPVILQNDYLGVGYNYGPYIVLLSETHDISIQGLTFDNNRFSDKSIKYHGTVSGTHITGNTFTSSTQPAMQIDFSPGGVYTDNTVDTNTFDNTVYSIMMESPTSNTRIVNNLFNNQHEQAVLANSVNTGTVIQHNTVNSVQSTQACLQLSASFNAVISENRLTGSFQNGIFLQSSGSKNEPVSVVNNIISGREDEPYSGSIGIYALGTKNLHIYHNTISILSNPVSAYTPIGIYLPADSVSVKNNLIISDENGYVYEIGNSLHVDTYIDYNNYWTTAEHFAYVDFHEPLATFDDYRTYTSYDAHGTTLDPMFYDGNFTPNNVQMNGTGIPIAAVTTDINGHIRDASHPDVGAVEYEVIALDAGLSVLSDKSWLCQLTPNYSVRLINSGLTTITSIELSWSLNGTNQPPIMWTGSLASGTSATYMFDNSAFPVGQEQTVVVKITKVNGGADGLASNDEVTQSFAILAPVLLGDDIDTCDGTAVVSVPASENFSEYQWTNPDGLIVGLARDVTVGFAGTYKLRAKDSNGCISFDSLVVNIHFVNPSITGPLTTCDGAAVLRVAPVNPAYHYAWSFGGQTLEATTSEITVYESGSYTASVTTGQCIYPTEPYFINVSGNQAQTYVIHADGNKLSVDPGGDQYQWYLNDEIMTDSIARAIYAAESGSYSVQVTLNGCSVFSAAYSFVITGLEDNDSTVTVFPNQTTRRTTIHGVNLSTTKLQWQDVTGKTLQAPVTTQQGNDLLVDLYGFAQGVYILQLERQGTTLTRKIVLVE